MLLTETILITISEMKSLYSLNDQILHKRKISSFFEFSAPFKFSLCENSFFARCQNFDEKWPVLFQRSSSRFKFKFPISRFKKERERGRESEWKREREIGEIIFSSNSSRYWFLSTIAFDWKRMKKYFFWQGWTFFLNKKIRI